MRLHSENIPLWILRLKFLKIISHNNFFSTIQVNTTTTEVLPAEEEPQPTTSTQNPQYAYELMKEANSNSLWGGSMSIHRQPNEFIWLPELKMPEEPTTKRRRTSTLTMVVGQESLRQGTLSLTCKASVYSLYNAQAELLLAAERPQIAPVVVLATGHTHSGQYCVLFIFF